MKIFKVERPEDDWGYNEYDGFVVIAENEAEARNTQPSSLQEQWPVSPNKLIVTEIGEANPDVKPGVILASFVAG